MTDDDANTRCTECGYEWAYSGFGSTGKAVATCPNCGCKTPTENMDATDA